MGIDYEIVWEIIEKDLEELKQYFTKEFVD
jgi:uncharacterized protein with HEPN domain